MILCCLVLWNIYEYLLRIYSYLVGYLCSSCLCYPFDHILWSHIGVQQHLASLSLLYNIALFREKEAAVCQACDPVQVSSCDLAQPNGRWYVWAFLLIQGSIEELGLHRCNIDDIPALETSMVHFQVYTFLILEATIYETWVVCVDLQNLSK